MKTQYLIVMVALMAVTSVNAATIRAVRCDGGHVRPGDDKYAILEKCGRPKYTEIISADNMLKRERLIYKLDNNRYYLTAFELTGGELVKIKQIRIK